MPFFSVIIPTYNRLPYLLEALESVARQSFTDYEIIVVDDGSTDGTAKEVERIIADGGWRIAEGGGRKAKNGKLKADRDGDDQSDLDAGPSTLDFSPVLRVLRQENAGPGAARNLGASVARGEYLAFLDSDDLWFPWSLNTYYEEIIANKYPVLLCGKIQEWPKEVSPSVETVIKSASKHYPNFISSFPDECFVGAGKMVVKKEDFIAIGGFCNLPINLEDHDCVLKLGDRDGFVQIDNPSTLIRRRHEGNVTAISEKTYGGARHLIRMEKSGSYPGGAAARAKRVAIISRHVRPVAVAALENGKFDAAWEIYKATLGWHLKLRKWKFLIGFPFAMAAKKIGK